MATMRASVRSARNLRYGPVLAGAAIAVCIALPFLSSTYTLYRAELILIYATAAMGLNIAIGFSGEMLLGQATVMGVAAYAAGLLSVDQGWSAVETLPVALVGGVVWQLIICIPGLRIREIYLGIVSFLAVLAYSDLAVILQRWTGGVDGLIGLHLMVTGSDGTADAPAIFAVVATVAVLAFVMIYLLVKSSWGLRFRALRDAPYALPTVGIGISSTKLVVYVMAALPAAAGGWALAYVNQDVTPSVFGVSLTLILFAGVQLIKPGSLIGPIVGTALLEGYSQLVGPFSQYNVFGLGLFLAALVLLFPGGLGRRPSFSRVRWLGRVATLTGARPTSRPAEPPAAGSLTASGARERKEMSEGGSWAELQAADLVTLEVSGLTRSFGGVLAVDGVSFAAKGGRIVALMGANGSGKTTTLNLISGLLDRTHGSVAVNGWETGGSRAHEIARHGYSRTFQIPQVIGESSVRENVELGLLRRHGTSIPSAIFTPWRARAANRARAEQAREVCSQLGIDEDLWERRVDEIPLGQRRLVEVGRCLATGASVICLDEPTAGLNDEELQDLSHVLKALAATGRAVLVVEHNVGFVLGTCDDVVLLDRGKVSGVFEAIHDRPLPLALVDHFGYFVEEGAVSGGHAEG